MLQILTGLYVGSMTDSCDNNELKKHGITHILSVCNVSKAGKNQRDINVRYVCYGVTKFSICLPLQGSRPKHPVVLNPVDCVFYTVAMFTLQYLFHYKDVGLYTLKLRNQ